MLPRIKRTLTTRAAVIHERGTWGHRRGGEGHTLRVTFSRPSRSSPCAKRHWMYCSGETSRCCTQARPVVQFMNAQGTTWLLPNIKEVIQAIS